MGFRREISESELVQGYIYSYNTGLGAAVYSLVQFITDAEATSNYQSPVDMSRFPNVASLSFDTKRGHIRDRNDRKSDAVVTLLTHVMTS